MLQKESENKLKSLLTNQEGYRQFPYKDTVGKLTIAIGRNLEEKGISRDEADVMLSNDIAYFDDQLHLKLPFYDGLDDVRKAVLIDMAFNLGLNGLMQFHKFLNLVSIKSFDGASVEMLKSKWATQVGQRAINLSKIMKTGLW